MPKERKKRQRKPRTDEKNALKKIRELSPNHVVEVELLVTLEQSIVLQRIQEQLRVIRNTVLGELKKRYDQMVRTKSHKKTMRRLHRIYEQVEHTVNKEKIATFEAEKKQLLEKLQAMQEAYRVTFAHGRLYGEMLHNTKYHWPDAVTVWSACEMAWQSIEGLLFRNAKNVYFYQRDDFITIQGKQAERSIILKYDKKTNQFYVQHNGMAFPLITKSHDLFIEETLSNVRYYTEHSNEVDQQNSALYRREQPLLPTYRIRNNRIVTKVIRGKLRYFLQMVLEGSPVAKRKKDGSFRHTCGTGRIGTDLGTQSLGVVTDEHVILKNLAERSPRSLDMEHKLANLQRYMDRSKRATNPQNFDEKGRVKKGRKTWRFSARYFKAKAKAKELHRKAAVNRKLAHNEEINRLRSYGDVLYIEPMKFKQLQRKTKEAKKDEKTGQWKRRKRFGKSIQNRSPGYFLSRVKQVFNDTGGHVYEVNNVTFAASQYDHILDEKNKKKLSQRWHVLPDGRKVQRDLYSAFLLYCANEKLEHPDKAMCDTDFEAFFTLHNDCVEKIRIAGQGVLNSGIHNHYHKRRKVRTST